MRYEKGHKEATRARIVEIASRRFRAEGIEAVGVASLMADAGLTHGGFYSHFKTKDALVAAAVGHAMARGDDRLRSIAEKDSVGLDGIIDFYLRVEHRDHPERGCAAAALASELPHHPPETRIVAATSLEDRIALIAEYLPETLSLETRRSRATAIMSVMMGALQLARLATDEQESQRFLTVGARTAHDIAEAS